VATGGKKRPRGNGVPTAVVRERLDKAEDLMTQGLGRLAIAKELGLPARTADRYRALVQARWEKEHERDRPRQVAIMLACLERDARDMRADKAWSALSSHRRLMADIRGLRAPEKLELKAAVLTANLGPAPLDLSRLSDDQFAALQAAYGALSLAPAREPEE